MKNHSPLPNNDKPATPSNRFKDWFDRYRWTYLLGWLFIAGIALVIKFVGPTLFQYLASIVDLVAPSVSLGMKIVLQVALLVVIPLVVGLLAEFLLHSLQGRRNVEALQTMQKKLFAELAPGDSRGFPVALVDFPRPELRSVAVVTATFKEAAGDRELAAIYLPGTPDPTKGALRIVAVEDLTFTDWSLDDLTDFHITFGSVSPTSC